MKPYGLDVIEMPDVADIHAMGAKSSVGTLKGKGGDHRGYHKNKAKKRRTRRYWKRKERAKAKAVCKEFM